MFELSKVLEFENDSRLYEFTIPKTEIPLWLMVRITAMNSWGWSKEEYEYFLPKSIYKHEHLDEELTVRNPYNSKNKNILYAFFRNYTMMRDKDGRVYEDKFFSFLEEFKEDSTVLVQFDYADDFDFKCDYPDWKSCYAIDMEVQKRADGEIDETGIREFVDFLKLYAPYEMDRTLCRKITKHVYYLEQQISAYIAEYEKYLRIIKPKIAVVYWAHYLETRSVALIQACRKLGIVTAEIQPAMYNKNIFGCNFGNYIINNERCKRLFPDYILTRGVYWNKYIKSPATPYVIGTPYLDNICNISDKNILFTVGEEFDQYENFLNDILTSDHDFKIYFRFHPGRVTQEILTKFSKFKKHSNFEFANEHSFTHYLNFCKYLISDGGTVIYEALTVGRTVFAFDTKAFRKNGPSDFNDVYVFSDANAFLKLWELHKDDVPIRHTEIYELNWKEKYAEFMKMVGAIDT
ncbi:MAG: hypothetical protein K2O16_05935 [Lachnospiraceae bacterium]|nr:hypothetical protein [Lachnospiraceae bacterium]